MTMPGIIPGLIYVDVIAPSPRNPLLIFIELVANEMARLGAPRTFDFTTRVAMALDDETKALMIHEGVWREFEGETINEELAAWARVRLATCHAEAIAMGLMGAPVSRETVATTVQAETITSP